MMVHTKGPWRAERQKSFSYSIHTDYVHDRGHDCNVVREVRCEANAFLIAAAPELLEACKAVQAACKGGDWAEAIKLSKAAIAKAEGR